ncbi:hypothetical protein [Chryseobacterium indologenes]|uniref:hypothetical protein n=1 Tax=Chryseobacterium indologenes TaxID=253 RepID=UPI0009A1FC23|nr:hypothetical protein [Chryseobacterium indologenes]
MGGVDPLADIHPNMTPFRYSFNNPINVIDPTGLLEDDWELNAVTGDLKKVTENDKPDVLYVVNEKGKRITDKGNTVKFTMERDEQIEEREIVSENVKYNPKPGVDGEKEVKYESYKFDNQSKGKSFFEFLAKYSNAGNEFDLFQYTQNGIDKALVGRTLQFSYLTRFTQDSNNPKQYDFGGFLPSIGLKTGLYNRTSNLPGVDSSKNIFTHSHPGDGKNPEASPADINTAKYNSLPGIFNVYSGGVYKEIPRK